MGKAEVFRIPVVSSFFRALGGFPVDRDGTDRKALATRSRCCKRVTGSSCSPKAPARTGTRSSRCSPARRTWPCGPTCRWCRSDRRHRGDRAQQWPALVPRFDRVAIVVGEPIVPPARTKSRVPRAEVDTLTAQLADALQETFDDASAFRAEWTHVAAQLAASGRVWRAWPGRVGARSSTNGPPTRGRGAGRHRRRTRNRVECGDQLELARRGEVLVFVGDPHGLDAVLGRELRRSPRRRVSGALAPAVTPTIVRAAERSRSSSSGPSTPSTTDSRHPRATS